MSDPSAELSAISEAYTRAFAARPRATRNLVELDGLVARLQAIQGAPGTTGETARAALDTYSRERTLIAEVQAGGASARKHQVWSALANHLVRRYQRHYAGQQRWTRDLAQLQALCARLQTLLDEGDALAKTWDHATFSDSRRRNREQLAAYQRELREVVAAIGTGASSDKASALANRANAVFRWYRLSFAGQSRLGRRPALLEQLVQELEGVLAGMDALTASGYRTAAHDKNAGIVRERLQVYRDELTAIRRVQSDQGYSQVFEATAQSANALFERYRSQFAGKSRAAMDPAQLEELTDALLEVALHMDDLDRFRGDDRNLANLLIVLENLSLYEAEVDRIRQARAPKS